MPKKSSTKKQNPSRSRSGTNATGRNVAPVAFGYQAPQPHFKAKAPKEGSACFEGVDYVGSANSSNSAAFAGVAQYIYPTNSTLFPRLAAIADVWLRYRFKKLMIHFVGKSATTQAGAGAFSSLVMDGDASGITVNTESIVKNTQGCLILKGWESGRHVVDLSAQGLKWYNTDSSGTANPIVGAVLMYTPQTTAAGDLSWDWYVEYEIEFDESVSGSMINVLREKRTRVETDHAEEQEQERTAVDRLKERLKLLEKR